MGVRIVVREKAPPRTVTFAVSPLAELGAALHVLCEPEHHPHEAGWVSVTRSAMTSQTVARVEALAPLWGSYRSRLLFPLTVPRRPSAVQDKTLAEELAAIEQMPLDRFVELTAFAVRGGNSGESLRDIGCDERVRRRFIDRARRRGRGAEAIGEDLLSDPATFRRSFVDFLREMDAVALDVLWARRSVALRRDVASRREVAAARGVLHALRSLSGSISQGEAADVLYVDKIHHGLVDVARQPIVVVPTSVGWPHLLIKHERGWPAVLQYPISVETAADSTSLALLQLRLSVLADPVRLRVCRAVARESRTTADLAEAWGISSAQVSRHLRALREAGLVTSTRNGRFVSYQLDAGALARLGADLVVALLR